MFELKDIVCFRENHKWVGCLGFVNEIKKVKKDDGKYTVRLMIGVPVPQEENKNLRDLYLRTAKKLDENGKEELADYFLAQIGAVPTLSPQ